MIKLLPSDDLSYKSTQKTKKIVLLTILGFVVILLLCWTN